MVVDPQQLPSNGQVLTRKTATAEIGSSGLKRWAGRVTEEFLPELQGIRGVRVYDEMRKNDPVIGSVLAAIKATVRSVSWNSEPADKSAEAERWRLHVEQCMDDMSQTWQDFIGEALTVIPFGWAYHEVCYKVRAGEDADPPSKYTDGLIGWRKVPLRKQDSLSEWAFDDNGGIQGMWQQVAQPTYRRIFLPIQKAILFRLDQEANNPEGISALRTSYRPWYMKKNHEEIEGIGAEQDFTGFRWVNLPASASRADYDVGLSIVERGKVDEQGGIVTQKGQDASGRDDWDIQLLQSPGSKQIDLDKVIRRYAGEMATAFLAQFLRLGQDGRTGSYALSKTHKDFFHLAIQTILDIFEETINRYMVAPLMRLNGVSTALYPKLAHGRIAPQEVDTLIAALKVMADTGLLGQVDDQLVQFLRSEMDLPPAPEQLAPPTPEPPPEEDPTEPDDDGSDATQVHELRTWYALAEEDFDTWVEEPRAPASGDDAVTAAMAPVVEALVALQQQVASLPPPPPTAPQPIVIASEPARRMVIQKQVERDDNGHIIRVTETTSAEDDA